MSETETGVTTLAYVREKSEAALDRMVEFLAKATADAVGRGAPMWYQLNQSFDCSLCRLERVESKITVWMKNEKAALSISDTDS